MAVAATVTVAAGASWLAFRSKAPEVRTASNILSSAPASGAATTAARSTDSQATVSSDSAPVIAPRQDSPAAAAEVATRKPVTPPAVASKAVVTAPAGQAAASSPEFGRARVTEMEPRANLAQGAPPAALRRPVPQQLAEVRAEPATAPAPLLAADGEPIASRIGLDEAREQLGGNLHVIDGLQPEMVGLVPGRLVPGADSSRPVVRVVYLDGDGHSFFLDQQRVTSAPALGAAMARMASVPGSWRAGDVQLRLHGAIPDDSLARLQRRVR